MAAMAGAVAAAPGRSPQSTLRRVTTGRTAAVQPVRADTVGATDSMVRLSGYDKPLRSAKESFFVTSAMDDTICGFMARLDYTDMEGRALHSREVTVDVTLAPGETRRVEIPSWDTQKSFYYHRSTTPKRARSTPYQVRATISAVIRP